MKTHLSRWGVLGIVVLALALGGFSQTGEDLFQKALRLEQNEGKMTEAIALYQQVIAGQSSKALAAQAQLRIGMCYEKMGTAEAVKAYELVVEKYPEVSEAVAQARSRLAALSKEEQAGLTMTRLLPSGVYLECPSLSPDGTKVLGIDFETGQNVAAFDLAAGKLNRVTDFDWKKDSLWTYVPVWSPSGRKFAFQAGYWTETQIARMLWISDLTGKSRKVFENPHGSVVPCGWLHEEGAIAAVFTTEKKAASLGVISVEDGSLREICPLLRVFTQGGDPAQAIAAGSVDVSPNGRFIAFSDGPSGGGRDIYIFSMEGGSKTLITDHPADDREPRWSPDGRHIVFLSDRSGSRALWGVAIRDGQPDGQPFMILEGMQDTELSNWTKKGLLSQSSAVIQDIYTLEIDPKTHEVKGKPRIVDYTPSGWNYWPLWSPDGKSLAFFSPWELPSPTFSSDEGDNSVVIIPSEGKGDRKYNVPTQIRRGRWLSDGSGLEIIGQGDDQTLYSHRLDLATGKWTSHRIPAAGISSVESAGAASDEGKSCFYVFQPQTGSFGSDLGVYAWNPETGQKRFILKENEIKSLPWSLLGISRDKKRLACGSGGNIALIDVGTGRVQKLEFKKEALAFPAWSPDGKFLVALGKSGDGSARGELFIVSLEEGQARSLDISRYLPPKTQIFLTPDWSPDGWRIAFGTRLWKTETNLIRNVITNK